MQKNSFVLQTRLGAVVAKLSDKQAGALFKGILKYAENGTIANFEDSAVDIVFEMARQDIDYTAKKYAETCAKNAENGKLGGRPKNRTVIKKPNGYLKNPKKPHGYFENHNDNDVDVDNDDDIKTTTLLPLAQKDPQAGTFRATPKTKMQKFGTWWVKTYYPELYATAGAKATAAWFKRYGRALSELLSLADGSVSLAVSAALATQEQMAEFQKRKGEPVLWGLESVCRNFTENFVRAQEIQKSGVLPQEVADA